MQIAIPIVEPTRPMTNSIDGIRRARNKDTTMINMVMPRNGPSGIKCDESQKVILELMFLDFFIWKTYLFVHEGENTCSTWEYDKGKAETHGKEEANPNNITSKGRGKRCQNVSCEGYCLI